MPDPTRHPRVRVLNVSYSTVVWGAEHTILRLAPLFADRGIDVALAGRKSGPLEAAWRETGLPFVGLDVLDHRGLRSDTGEGRPGPLALGREGLTVTRSITRMAPVVRRTACDVVHSHSLQAHLELATAARVRRRRAVLHQHDLVAPGMGRTILGLATRLGGELIAISNAVADSVPAHARNAVDVVHHGVDLQRFYPAPANPVVRAELGGVDGAPLVGILGRLDPTKQVEVLVRALARLDVALSNVRLAIVGAPFLGSDAYVQNLQSEARARLGDRVRFVGARADVPDVLRALDMLVNASVAEPFGLTLIEAQACGVPVVATRSGGAPEIVREGETGFLVPPGDDHSLSQALDRLLRDDLRRRDMGVAARRYAEAHLDIRTQADRIAAIYRRLASRRSAAFDSSSAPR